MRQIPNLFLLSVLVTLKTLPACAEVVTDAPASQLTALGFSGSQYQDWRRKIDQLNVDPNVAANVVVEAFRIRGIADDDTSLFVTEAMSESLAETRPTLVAAELSGRDSGNTDSEADVDASRATSEKTDTSLWLFLCSMALTGIIIVVVGTRTCAKWIWSRLYTSRALMGALFMGATILVASLFLPAPPIIGHYHFGLGFQAIAVGAFTIIAGGILLLLTAFLSARRLLSWSSLHK